MASIPSDEIVIAARELSPKAYQLLMYYYSKSDGWKFDDDEIAKSLGIGSSRMVKQYRKELISKNYLWIAQGELTVYIVGRQAVENFKNCCEANNNSGGSY